MDDGKRVVREVEQGAKKAWRRADGDESPADQVGNAGDELRKQAGNAGDDMRKATDDAVEDRNRR